jgi:hypothetical protein
MLATPAGDDGGDGNGERCPAGCGGGDAGSCARARVHGMRVRAATSSEEGSKEGSEEATVYSARRRARMQSAAAASHGVAGASRKVSCVREGRMSSRARVPARVSPRPRRNECASRDIERGGRVRWGGGVDSARTRAGCGHCHTGRRRTRAGRRFTAACANAPHGPPTIVDQAPRGSRRLLAPGPRPGNSDPFAPAAAREGWASRNAPAQLRCGGGCKTPPASASIGAMRCAGRDFTLRAISPSKAPSTPCLLTTC